MAVLHVYEGVHRRTSVTLSQAAPANLGRDSACTVYLPDDPSISRTHAILEATDDGWLLRDVSRNGTSLNGRDVVGVVRLRPQDRLGIGRYVVVFAPDDHTTETVTSAAPGPGNIQRETGLTTREVEVVQLVASGFTDQGIAEALFISVRTVHSHLDRIANKTGQRRRPDLVQFALRHGLI